MRFPTSLAALLVLAACQPAGDAEEQPAAEAAAETAPAAAAQAFDVSSFTGTTYGEPLTLTELTPVSAILADPLAYIGKPVLVRGMVVAVCEEKGCWMDIASDKEFEKIQVKVDDGVIVFPLTAKGKQALVEGVVEQLELTYEQALAEAKRKAAEHGEAFDSTSVTGPQTIFRIRGKGAVVAE
ncbi:MAG: DUF4920 domain-containing protein [Longimicrobiales bacterium]